MTDRPTVAHYVDEICVREQTVQVQHTGRVIWILVQKSRFPKVAQVLANDCGEKMGVLGVLIVLIEHKCLSLSFRQPVLKRRDRFRRARKAADKTVLKVALARLARERESATGRVYQDRDRG